MRRWAFVSVALLFVAAAPAGAGETGGITGEVLDATCYGPCTAPPPDLTPYAGHGLVVSVRTLPDRARVAKLYPDDGAFELQAAPGVYRVRARVKQECWRGQRRRIVVDEGAYSRVTLRVQNDCIR